MKPIILILMSLLLFGCATMTQKPSFNPNVGNVPQGGVGAIQQTGAVNAQLNKVADDIAGVRASVGDIKGEVAGIKASVGDVTAAVGDVTAKVGVFEASVGDINNKMGVVEMQLRDVSTSITVSANANIKGFETALENVNAEMGVIKTQLGDIATSITITNEAHLTGFDTKIGDISTRIGRDVNTSLTQEFAMLRQNLHGEAGRDLDQSVNKYGGLVTGIVAVVALVCAAISILSMRKAMAAVTQTRELQRAINRSITEARSMQSRSTGENGEPIYINWENLGKVKDDSVD